jgi:hypothetical protein
VVAECWPSYLQLLHSGELLLRQDALAGHGLYAITTWAGFQAEDEQPEDGHADTADLDALLGLLLALKVRGAAHDVADLRLERAHAAGAAAVPLQCVLCPEDEQERHEEREPVCGGRGEVARTSQ